MDRDRSSETGQSSEKLLVIQFGSLAIRYLGYCHIPGATRNPKNPDSKSFALKTKQMNTKHHIQRASVCATTAVNQEVRKRKTVKQPPAENLRLPGVLCYEPLEVSR